MTDAIRGGSYFINDEDSEPYVIIVVSLMYERRTCCFCFDEINFGAMSRKRRYRYTCILKVHNKELILSQNIEIDFQVRSRF